MRYVNSITASEHGVTVVGDMSKCLVDEKSAHTDTEVVTLKGDLIPGKNGRLCAPLITTSGASGGGGVGVGGLSQGLGLPRGSGFCACWLRGRHCVKDSSSSGSGSGSGSGSSSGSGCDLSSGSSSDEEATGLLLCKPCL